MNIGVIKRQAQVIGYETEEFLWSSGILGEDTPDKLRNTVLFLIGINVLLRAVDEHYSLRRPFPNYPSQLSFETNQAGVKCLVYREDHITKTHDGGLNDMRKDRKIVWVYPSEDVTICPVRLVEKYISLLSPSQKKENFYMRSLQKPTPKRWYSNQVVGTQNISKVVKQMMKDASIDGFFTNHSLRRTGGTRLFRTGIDRKLVKEVTGHRSDAVDSYQITSDEQRQNISKIIQKPVTVPESEGNLVNREGYGHVGEVSEVIDSQKLVESDKKSDRVDESNVGDIVSQLVRALKENRNGKVKINIEITSE